jgi:hypothetical protein
MAGKCAIEFSITGPNLTVCDGPNSCASSLLTASTLRPENFPVLLCCVDEHIELLRTLYPHFSDTYHEYIHESWEEGAVAFLLDCDRNDPVPQIQATGPVPVNERDPEEVCRTLAVRFQLSEYMFIPPRTGSTSYIAPGIIINEQLHTHPSHRTVVGSYSTTARACACIGLWL